MSKKFKIFGMGNALVDREFSIDDAKLAELNIDKGLMTLIEADRLEELLAKLSNQEHAKAGGGSAANTMMAAQLLGSDTFYSCKVANDAQGDFFYNELVAKGIVTNLSANERPEGNTGTCIVKITPDAERTMCTYLGITATYSEAELDDTALTASEYLYIEGYLVAAEDACRAAIKAKQLADQAGVKTSITLSDPNMVQFFKQNIIDIIGDGVDLIFCNEQEALMFCETDDLTVAQESLKKYAKTSAITLGSEGALVFDGQSSYQVETAKVNVLDTVGAGDTFAGGFLYALTQGLGYKEAAAIANHAAGLVVSKLGPRLNENEAQQILNTTVAAQA
ncbi:MAG: adenosine kinase [Coxiellaceae bacterium]|nr:adenosine kinase [Coxiellaceae bacterium]